jgi:hypothetical protein
MLGLGALTSYSPFFHGKEFYFIDWGTVPVQFPTVQLFTTFPQTFLPALSPHRRDPRPNPLAPPTTTHYDIFCPLFSTLKERTFPSHRVPFCINPQIFDTAINLRGLLGEDKRERPPHPLDFSPPT